MSLKFYPPKMTRVQAGYQYTQFCMSYAISDEMVINTDLFYQHIGRRPIGDWALHCVNPNKIVWVPREFKDSAEEWLKFHKPPFCPIDLKKTSGEYKEARADVRAALQWEHADVYLRRYYDSFIPPKGGVIVDKTRFPSYESFRATVGLRPTKDHFLTTVDQTALTPENFVWVTQGAINRARKDGEVEPPSMLSPIDFLGVDKNPEDPTNPEVLAAIQTKTIQRKAINDQRFSIFAKPLLEKASRRLEYEAAQKEASYQWSLLADKMRDYLASKGYTGYNDVFNPKILPREEHPKFNEARDLLSKLSERSNWTYSEWCRRQSLNACNERRKQAALLNPASANRLHTGKRGRPMERFVKAKVLITSLTPEQKQLLNLPPNQHYTRNPATGRKTRFVEVMVPNPRLKNDTPSAEIADKTPNDSSLAA